MQPPLEPGPAIVCCRHVNLLDASLPSLLYHSRGFHVQGVIMAEMLADPGFDLLYGRLGSVFIPRDRGPEARHAVTDLGSSLDARSVAVIFPEGRLFRPELLQRALTKLQATDPDRAKRLAELTHVLPPRPGGVNALLDAAPNADIAARLFLRGVTIVTATRIALLVGNMGRSLTTPPSSPPFTSPRTWPSPVACRGRATFRLHRQRPETLDRTICFGGPVWVRGRCVPTIAVAIVPAVKWHDEQLVAAVGLGDDRAHFAAATAPWSRGAARTILGRSEGVDEVVADAFIGLWEHPDRFDPQRGSLPGFRPEER